MAQAPNPQMLPLPPHALFPLHDDQASRHHLGIGRTVPGCISRSNAVIKASLKSQEEGRQKTEAAQTSPNGSSTVPTSKPLLCSLWVTPILRNRKCSLVMVIKPRPESPGPACPRPRSWHLHRSERRRCSDLPMDSARMCLGGLGRGFLYVHEHTK